MWSLSCKDIVRIIFLPQTVLKKHFRIKRAYHIKEKLVAVVEVSEFKLSYGVKMQLPFLRGIVSLECLFNIKKGFLLV